MLNLIDKLLAHSRTIEILRMARDTVHGVGLRCRVEDVADDMVPAIEKTALELVKTYRKVKEAYTEEAGPREVIIPDLDGWSPEEQAKLKADLSRVISAIDKNTTGGKK